MENHLPSADFRPEDEYPALGAKPITAAEPTIESAERPAVQPVESAPAQPAPAAQPVQPPVQQPYQQPYQQNTTIPYMTYPIGFPFPGMTQYPQQQYPQQQYPQQQYPQQQYPQQQYPQQQYPQQQYPQQQYPQQQYPQQQYVQGPFRYPDYTGNFVQYPQQTQRPQQPVQPQQPQQPAQSVQPSPQNGGYVPYGMPAAKPAAPQAGIQPPAEQLSAPYTPEQTPYPAPDYSDAIPRDQKAPTSTGTKAFLIILSALLLAMIVGFVVYIVNASSNNTAKNQQENAPVFQIGGDEDDNINDFNIIDNYGSGELKHSELEEEITLVTDDGATQKRDTDNPDSIGTPDKNAKGIELKDLPKDADKSSDYTAKSSFNALADSVVTISCYEKEITENVGDIISSGSGTIISADGYVITNAHVLNNSKQFAVNVTLNDGKKYQAKIVGYDTWSDLAVLKIDAKELKPAEFGNSDNVEVGDDVIAIGSPGGAKYQNSLTQGVVSAVDREISVNKFVRFIQSDATINPGSSGGPLCNLYGQVIGITTAKTVAQNYENMSFSIPSTLVKEIVTDLIHYGYIPNRARIGFSGNEVTSEDKLYFGLPSGVIIGEIADDGALKGTDVKSGDIITAIDGEEITSFQDIYNILAKHKAGDKLKLSIYRVEEEGFFEEEPTQAK